eukprot:TRINITY_DN4615_c0_g1_i1.p1 TRINITY_DN4615_c0_g1~~TRINITY_DN4615_c0_g1_i1.p1  ORF type:complete len:438 (-),score=98.89 TRINITY_DN4615_c0_g1_i1:99-1412(-)
MATKDVIPGCTLVTELAGKVARVDMGFAYIIATLTSGRRCAWGIGEFGTLLLQPGDYTGPTWRDNSQLPREMPPRSFGGHYVTQLSCGDTMVLGLTAQGAVVAWGSNQAGRLGIGLTQQEQFGVVEVKALSGKSITKVQCGGAHTLALAANGDVYSWGSGGVSSFTTSVAVTGGIARLGHGIFIPEFALVETYPCLPFPCRVPCLPPACDVACGQWHSFVVAAAVRDNGTRDVYGFGGNAYGQLGLPAMAVFTPTRVPSLSDLPIRVPGGLIGGRLHSAAVTLDGMLHTLGWGEYYQLGTGSAPERSSNPAAVTALRPFVVEAAAVGKFHTLTVVRQREGCQQASREEEDDEEDEGEQEDENEEGSEDDDEEVEGEMQEDDMLIYYEEEEQEGAEFEFEGDTDDGSGDGDSDTGGEQEGGAAGEAQGPPPTGANRHV